MKVVLFSTQWPEYMVELANALSKHCKVTLLIPSNHRFTNRHRELLSQDVNLVTYKVIFHKSIRENSKMLLTIWRNIWKIRPDILHLQANGHRLFYWIAFFIPWKTKIVNTIHDPVKHIGDEASSKIQDDFNKNILKFATDKYVVHGITLKEQIIKEYKIESVRVCVIPHGNFKIYKKFQEKDFKIEHKNYVLFYGRIWKYKGLQYFIDAASEVSKKYNDVYFYIVGTGEPISNYQIPIGLEKRFVIINKYVDLNETAHYVENCSFIVMPYIEATQSGVIPLAYSFKKPVIASRVGAIPEVVIDGKTGYLVEPENTFDLIEKMTFLIKNSEIIEKMGIAALQFSENQLSWENIAEKTARVYKEFH